MAIILKVVEACVCSNFFSAVNLYFVFVEGKYTFFKPEKSTSDCAKIDSCHGDYLDPGICVGFLSHSIFGISIRHHQQLSRYVLWSRPHNSVRRSVYIKSDLSRLIEFRVLSCDINCKFRLDSLSERLHVAAVA